MGGQEICPDSYFCCMKKSKLIFVSDIHYTGLRPESEGAVLKAFLLDVKNHLQNNQGDEVFVLIGGDLVQAADNANSYELLYENVFVPLFKMGINKEHFIIVPGNHDIQQSWIRDRVVEYAPFIQQQFDEIKFNDYVSSSPSFLIEKFKNYTNFVNQKFGPVDTERIPIGYTVEINDDWSLYGINTSLLSFAGFDSADYPHLKNDTGRLCVYTREIFSWIEKNSKKKILLMHHPFSELSEWASKELLKLCNLSFDLVLTGHVHEQNILCNVNGSDSFIWCSAPQLFTDKKEKLGYSIVNLDGEAVDSIVYREWFEKRNAFRPGLDFTTEEDGIVKILHNRDSIKDATLVRLEENYRDTMSLFGDEPPVWVDRYFSLTRFDRSFRFKTDDLFSEEDLISDEEHNIKIITPSQYGLTSFAWHFLLRLWKEQKKFGLFIDCGIVKRGNIDTIINRQLSTFVKQRGDVERIVIDNWNVSDKEARVILKKLESEFPKKPIIILCPLLEKRLAETEIVTGGEYEFVNMFMAPLQTHQVRSMVGAYNRRLSIGDEESILQRLNADIIDFNMHRTPLNCISLLEVFSYSYDDNPVNRTELIKRLLDIIFENEEVPTYKSLPDVKDCEFAIGYYCEQMIRNESFYFREREICDSVTSFCKNQKLSLDVSFLFQILLKNQIICQYDIDLYGFRFSFWVYYFAAKRMSHSKSFAEFILDKENYAHYPEILEFYTGSDRSKEDAAEIVAKDMERLVAHVDQKIGIPENLNPFKQLKYSPSASQIESTVKQLEDNLQLTSLPSNIKDAMVDAEYNPSLPYHQEVYKVFKNYSVSYMQEMIVIASKVVRNSDYISPDLKVRLFSAVTSAWINTVRVIYLMAPALAKDSEAGYDGFNLYLADGFSKFDKDINQKLIQIIVNIPNNILRWYKDDLYSVKLADLLFERVKNEPNPIIRHLLVGLIIRERPSNWDNIVKVYLSQNDSKSFYFGDTIDSLKEMYVKGALSEQDIARTRTLILLAYTKLLTGGKYLQAGRIKDLNIKRILPPRDESDEE